MAWTDSLVVRPVLVSFGQWGFLWFTPPEDPIAGYF